MKKGLSILLAAILTLGVFLIYVPTYKAEGEKPEVTIKASKKTLSDGGIVKFTIGVKNTQPAGGVIFTNVTGNYESEGNEVLIDDWLEPGESKEGTLELDIPKNMIGKDLKFTVTYNINEGEAGIVTKTIKIDFPKAVLTAKCEVDRTAAPEGVNVNFTITLKNDGEATLNNIEVFLLPVNNKKKIASTIKELRPEASRTITYAYKMGDEDIDITPTIKYKANGEDFTKELAVKKLVIANPGLDLELSADKESLSSPGDEVEFKIVVKNSGNALLKNIKVFDHLQEEVKTGLSLMPEKSASYTKKFTFQQTTEVVFTATAEDKDGLVYNYKSNKVVIKLPIDPSKVKMELTAAADVTELTEPGTVKFKVTLKNTGGYPLQNVVITEDKLGEFDKADSLEVGEKYFEKEYEVTETGTYVFKVTAQDADGNPYTAESAPLEIKVQPAAESTAPDFTGAIDVPTEQTGSAKGDTLGTIIIIMVVVVVLIVAVVVALIVLVNKEKRNASRQSKGMKGAPAKSVKYRNKNNF